MDVYLQLRREARAIRDKDIRAARQRYEAALVRINKLRVALGSRRPTKAMNERRVRRGASDTPIDKLPLLAAAERILMERGRLAIAELVVELQARGCRSGDSPFRVKKSVTSAFYYHKFRFMRDADGRWTVI